MQGGIYRPNSPCKYAAASTYILQHTYSKSVIKCKCEKKISKKFNGPTEHEHYIYYY